MKSKKETIKELLQYEVDFRDNLMKVKISDPLMQIGRMMIINQSLLFSMKLETLKHERKRKKIS